MAKDKDILAGLTEKTPKEELRNRLRQAATLLRKQDRHEKAKLEEIEARLRAKHQATAVKLRSVITSGTDEEWKDSIEFLEEFESEGLLPTALQRLAVGGRVLLGQDEK